MKRSTLLDVLKRKSQSKMLSSKTRKILSEAVNDPTEAKLLAACQRLGSGDFRFYS